MADKSGARNTGKPESEKLEKCDPLWSKVLTEAQDMVRHEPALASFVYASVLSHSTLEEAICYGLARLLEKPGMDASILKEIFEEVLMANPQLAGSFRADLSAVYDRDPACTRYIEPLLYFKGFHALESYRFAHHLWGMARKDMALYMQSQTSRVFGIDIHPAARIGQGIMMDHASGIVIGETAAVGDNTSILHNVTLGGTGKEGGDRHPKIGRGVMIGAGAKILGNIHVGDCSRIASGSVVLKDVPANSTVAGVPAKVIGPAGCSEPSRSMDQMLRPRSSKNGCE